MAYICCELPKHELAYPTIQKECLAIKWPIETLKYYLVRSLFTIITDHASFKWLKQMKTDNPCLTKRYLILLPYNFTVEHRLGKRHVSADFFSRIKEKGRHVGG